MRHILLALVLFTSCKVINLKDSNVLTDNTYFNKETNEKVYVKVEEDSVYIFQLEASAHGQQVSSSGVLRKIPSQNPAVGVKPIKLRKNSLDVDFLTIPLKFRKSVEGIPSQLNASLGAAAYLGLRTDHYTIKSQKNALGDKYKKTSHFGLSFGVLSGLGNSFISPTTTNLSFQYEYDGLVWSNGLAGIIALDNFTLGLSVGFDRLLDRNREIWIYQNELWMGLAFGINLN